MNSRVFNHRVAFWQSGGVAVVCDMTAVAFSITLYLSACLPSVSSNICPVFSPGFFSRCLHLARQAGEGRWGTDELAFNEVLAKRSYKQLRATFQAYQIVSREALRLKGSFCHGPELFLKEAKLWDVGLSVGDGVVYISGSQWWEKEGPGYC